ncbi:flavin-containing monooxygenase [Pseudomonas knackmussii]|uniref:flavin-containing monooxygenase n=1 Tax=Pseudomonas knackmussii TaxID=65741 RepID=UPI003BDD0C64
MTVQQSPAIEHLDVLIIGAGLSGIGAAYYLQRDLPGKRYAILEGRAASGGTWDLFRYPGIRSDSDLYTFGYEFKPWRSDEAIADAAQILDYLRETARENGIDRHIRYQHKVKSADWCSQSARWTVTVERLDTGEQQRLTCTWLFSAAGYYRYDEGFTPRFEGIEQYAGQVIHPQQWPEDLDYSGKRVLVIGSGATAVTLVPAMTPKAAHVTMLQRTPTYVMNIPQKDPIALLLRRLLPAKQAHQLTRYKNVLLTRGIWLLCQKYPRFARRLIRFLNKRELPEGYPVDEHFNPPYNPWDQRLCAVPDGDLFKCISEGSADIVTDRIRTFTPRGVALESGKELEADIVITATGLNLQLFGGMQMAVDGQPVDFANKVAFKGMMLDGLPNFAFAVGYTNASWTLKVGLLCEHFCRLVGYLDEHGYAFCYPQLPSPDMPTRPLLDFGAGYVQRALPMLPRQGMGAPWLMSMNYLEDAKVLRRGPVLDPNLRFAVAGTPVFPADNASFQPAPA